MNMEKTGTSLMSIRDLIGKMSNGNILIPEFAGEAANLFFTVREIEVLFERIYAGWPVEEIVFWKCTEPVPNVKFYSSVQHLPLSKTEEPYRTGVPGNLENKFAPFRAVLYGAHILNFLYFGLRGIDAFHFGFGENCPPLYLNLYWSDNSIHRNRNRFLCLSEDIYKEETQNGSVWVQPGRVLDEAPQSIIDSVPLPPNAVGQAEKILTRLADRINSQRALCCYSVEHAPFDEAFDMFLCFPPPFSEREQFYLDDKLVYLLAAKWKQYDAKEEFRLLHEFIEPCNTHSVWELDDGLLRSCMSLFVDCTLVLSVSEVSEHAQKIEENWPRIRQSIKYVYGLLKQIWGEGGWPVNLGFGNILVYWFYQKGVRDENVCDDITAAKKWLALRELFSDFYGFGKSPRSDDVRKIKTFIDEIEGSVFPFDAIKQFMIENRIWKPYTDEKIEKLTALRADSYETNYLLPLLWPGTIAGESDKTKAVHLHPRSFFEDREKLKEVFGDNPDDLLFAADPKNWDSVLNLLLIPAEDAGMKEEMTLKEWAEKTGTPNSALCVDDGVSLDIKDFRAFIENRKKNITAVLRDLRQ